MDWFHDEVFKDTVYFLNNVFYNTSETTPTKWFRRANALDKAVFSHNAFYEAGGTHSDQQPQDNNAVLDDPQFVTDPADYKRNNGVLRIADSAANFKVKSMSPLIDAGRYHRNVGTEDFFGTHLYYGRSIDISIHEGPIGAKVNNPVDNNPIEEPGPAGPGSGNGHYTGVVDSGQPAANEADAQVNGKPAAAITRKQAAIMIARALRIVELQPELAGQAAADNVLSGFADDARVTDYARNALADCINVGIIIGQPGAQLAPKSSLKRAASIVMLERLLEQAGPI